jgi:Phage tail assembly chaperone protein
MWINNQTFSIYRSHAEIRLAFPQVSMPGVLTDEVIESLDIASVTQTLQPSEYVVEELPPQKVDGVWTQQWSVRPPTELETETKAAEVRSERNRLLTECDWTQTLDAPVNREAWATYRQQLRDVTAQGGFPWEVEWPSMPA